MRVANTTDYQASVYRRTLIETGWMPLVQIQQAEHFVLGGRRCTLVYDAADAEILTAIHHVQFLEFDGNLLPVAV